MEGAFWCDMGIEEEEVLLRHIACGVADFLAKTVCVISIQGMVCWFSVLELLSSDYLRARMGH